MKMNDFTTLENMCQFNFLEAGECFHVCTQENLPTVFHNEEEFKVAMNMVAMVCLMHPEVKVYTFSIMANHLHFVAAGSGADVQSLADEIVSCMASHPLLTGSKRTISQMAPRLHPVDNLDYLRNVIAYVNRNGPLVDPKENVFSYEWGTGKYFFNREAKLRYKESSHLAGQTEKRKLMRSHQLDKIGQINVLDGYVSPLYYCRAEEAELFFRDSRQYFYKVSKNIESQKEIAGIIGESIYYTDYDLIDVITASCNKKFGVKNASELTPKDKIELAKSLHYDYNASNKQISRLLKLSIDTVSMLFSN